MVCLEYCVGSGHVGGEGPRVLAILRLMDVKQLPELQ